MPYCSQCSYYTSVQSVLLTMRPCSFASYSVLSILNVTWDPGDQLVQVCLDVVGHLASLLWACKHEESQALLWIYEFQHELFFS